MASLTHLDSVLGESLELLMEASSEIKSLNEIDEKRCLRIIGRAISEIWSVRDEIYRVSPSLKRDFVKEYEHNPQRYEFLNDLFNQAHNMEINGDIESAKQLYQEIQKKSRFGYFRMLAESGLYRLMELNTTEQRSC